MAGPLRELALLTSYHKGQNDIAEDFYLPCMRRAARYDRAVGYFRSTIFIVAWPALREFVERGGRIRVICSHVLGEADIEALGEGYEGRLDEVLAARFVDETRSLLADDVLRDPARVLAGLVATGVIDLRVAVLKPADRRAPQGRIFHDKVGLFFDDTDNAVMFKGSMNETWTGLAADGNLESVDVAASWAGGRDASRVTEQINYFDALWNDRYPGLTVTRFPDLAREELESAAPEDWKRELDALESRSREDPQGRTLRPHQSAGLASWRANGRRGILQFCTGAGKTFTAVTAIREAVKQHNEVAIVVVPDRVLFRQWEDELRETTKDLGVLILRAGSGHSKWREHLPDWTRPGSQPRLVLATLRTASSADFRRRVAGGSHICLVCDEVHRTGSPKNRDLLDGLLFGGARLGLSATPERAGDPVGTQAIREFFEGLLEPRYDLDDAIRDGVLCRYFYHPWTVSLTEEEQQAWNDATKVILPLQARLATGDSTPGLRERVALLLIQRARIAKKAENKIDLAVEIVQQHYKDRERWLIYCEDLTQLEEVRARLRAAGHKAFPFHSQMAGDRDMTLAWLDRRGGIVAAVKCLDEGVDVPSVSHALILASSKNPREFIQRRGRVLRKSRGKALAHVFDAIVVPSEPCKENPDPITTGELARAVLFARGADNPEGTATLANIAIDLGIELDQASEGGLEEDEEEENDER